MKFANCKLNKKMLFLSNVANGVYLILVTTNSKCT